MWISDYRLVDFSAPSLRVTLGDKMGLTKNAAVREGVSPESSVMTLRPTLSCHHVTFRTRVRAVSGRSMPSMTGVVAFIAGLASDRASRRKCRRTLRDRRHDASQLAVSIPLRVDDDRRERRTASRSNRDIRAAIGDGRLTSRGRGGAHRLVTVFAIATDRVGMKLLCVGRTRKQKARRSRA